MLMTVVTQVSALSKDSGPAVLRARLPKALSSPLLGCPPQVKPHISSAAVASLAMPGRISASSGMQVFDAPCRRRPNACHVCVGEVRLFRCCGGYEMPVSYKRNEGRNPAMSRPSRRSRMITWTGWWRRGMRRPLMTASSTSNCSRSFWRAAPSAAALALWQLLRQ